MRLVRLVHLAFWRRHPLQAALPAAGIAIGVAAVVAIDAGSGGTVASFRETLERIEGRTTHQVVPGPAPLDGTLAWRLADLPGVEAAAPFIETMTLGPEPLRLIGIDPFAERGIRALGYDHMERGGGELFFRFLGDPGALLVSRPFLARHGLAAGDSIDLAVLSWRRRVFVLGALPDTVGGLRVPDNLAVGDIATVQELAGQPGITRIDLVLAPRDREATLARVAAALPPGATVKPAGGAAAYLEGLLAALRLNLGALSYLALFVALFLIYNAMLLAMLRRRRELAIVRCLGATRGEVLRAWLVEAAAIGIMGTAAGLLLGWAGGRLAVQGIAQTASDLYGYVRADAAPIGRWTLVKAVGAGLGASLAAALPLAVEAARTPPAHTSSRSGEELRASRRFRRAPVLAMPLLAAAGVMLAAPSRSPVPGYAAAAALAIAVALLVPAGASWLLARLHALHSRGAVGVVVALAAGNIRASLSRTGVAMAALTAALAMSIAIGTMVSSFRAELRGWLADAIRADIYLAPATADLGGLDARLDAGLVERLRRRPGVVAADTYRALEASVNGSDTFVAGVEVATYRTRANPRILAGPSTETFMDRLMAGDAGVSEALSRRLGIGPGDRFELRAAGRAITLRAAGILRDYTSDRGVVLLDVSRFTAAFGEHAPNSMALYLAPDADVEAGVAAIRSEFGASHALVARSNRTLRADALRVFDRTFVVARSLETIGIAVAAIGVLAALLAMLLERGRELATLRAVGLDRRQLDGMLLAESALMAVTAWIFALVAGAALALILLRVVNVRSFGWLLPFHPPWHEWLASLGWSVAAGVAAALYPLRRGRALAVATALREE